LLPVRTMIKKEQIVDLVNSFIDRHDKFVVMVSVGGGNKITVLVDAYTGITIDECAEISRYIESKLDREKEDYELVVSSPGLSEPFRIKEQYIKNTGRDVNILLKTGIKKTGKIISVAENGIDLEVVTTMKSKENKKKQNIIEVSFIEFSEIKHTKTIISFK
jgi:ribosome maturation factor RimP